MSMEVDLLLQEAKESIEAAQNYRSELQQRLHGLNQARKQVLRPPTGACVLSARPICPPPPPFPAAPSKHCSYFLFVWSDSEPTGRRIRTES